MTIPLPLDLEWRGGRHIAIHVYFEQLLLPAYSEVLGTCTKEPAVHFVLTPKMPTVQLCDAFSTLEIQG